MSTAEYMLVVLGALFAAAGIVLFAFKAKDGGASIIKIFKMEFQLGSSALVVFIMGVVMILVPFRPWDSSRRPEDRQHEANAATEPEPPSASAADLRRTTTGSERSRTDASVACEYSAVFAEDGLVVGCFDNLESCDHGTVGHSCHRTPDVVYCVLLQPDNDLPPVPWCYSSLEACRQLASKSNIVVRGCEPGDASLLKQ